MKTLREKIEGLQRYGSETWGFVRNDDGEMIRRAEVLHILAEHSLPIPDITPGGQPLSPAKQLPKWRRELERLRALADRSLLRSGEAGTFSQLDGLDKLRLCIESGKGECVVPESVARLVFGYVVGSQLMASPDGSSVRFRSEPFGVASRQSDRVLELIDQAGTSLCTP